MIIGVDVDGVLADTFVPWVACYNEIYPDRPPYVPAEIYSERAVADPELHALLSDPTLYDLAPLIPGAQMGVAGLRDYGRVVYITSCVQGMTDAKWRWLQKYGFLASGKTQVDDLVIAHDKTLIGVDVLIDDHIKNVVTFPASGILFDQPWNRSSDFRPRATSWPHVVSIVESLAATYIDY